MKVFAFAVVLILLLAIAGVAIFGFVLPKQKRTEAENIAACESLFNEGKYREAIPLLEAFIKEHQKSKNASDAHYYLAKSRQELGDYPQATELWDKIINKYSKSKYAADAHYYMAFNQEKDNKVDQAMENYRIVVDKFPDSLVVAGALLGIGRIDETKGQEDDAIAAYQNVLDKYPDTEFAVSAEGRLGDMNLKRFLEKNARSYEVQRGESLVTIARKFSITPMLIKKLNNFTGNIVSVGQTIRVIDGSNFNILISLSDRKLSLRNGDKLVKRYPVCVGKKETPTPTGDYKITDKAVDPTWFSGASTGNKGKIPGGDPRNELGSRWIGFKPAYGVHGTIFPESIGKAESHGCVRMRNKDVEELYDLVSEGIPIKIVS